MEWYTGQQDQRGQKGKRHDILLMDGFQIYNIKGHIDKEDADKYTNIWIYLKVFEDKMFCFTWKSVSSLRIEYVMHRSHARHKT